MSRMIPESGRGEVADGVGSDWVVGILCDIGIPRRKVCLHGPVHDIEDDGADDESDTEPCDHFPHTLVHTFRATGAVGGRTHDTGEALGLLVHEEDAHNDEDAENDVDNLKDSKKYHVVISPEKPDEQEIVPKGEV